MMVSTAMAVLPVWRSPMINSRWPRPMGIMASMALIPVWSGSFTGSRKITPGALRSRGISYSSPLIGPLPSIGSPNVLITRPHIPSPTLMEAILPVRFTLSPSLISLLSPINTTPTLSSSRFRAMAFTPFPNSTSSPERTLFNPYTRAIPSPTWRTVPTSSRLAPALKLLSCWRSIAEISSGLISTIVV